jgi:hypothetical protein
MAIEAWIARRRGLGLSPPGRPQRHLSCGITSQLFNIFTSPRSRPRLRLRSTSSASSSSTRAPPRPWLLGMLGVDFFYYWWHRPATRSTSCGPRTSSTTTARTTTSPSRCARPCSPTSAIPFSSRSRCSASRRWSTSPRGPQLPLPVLDPHRAHRQARPASSASSTPPRTTASTTPINPQYLDKNYAGILILWDRLFGSFEPEHERPVYGITKPLRSLNPLWANLHYFIDIAGSRPPPRAGATCLHALDRPPRLAPPPIHAPTPPSCSSAPSTATTVPASPALALYILVQAALAVPATMLLLLHGLSLPPGRARRHRPVAAGAVAWAGLFERGAGRWALAARADPARDRHACDMYSACCTSPRGRRPPYPRTG